MRAFVGRQAPANPHQAAAEAAERRSLAIHPDKGRRRNCPQELDHRYQALLQLYGEKIEQFEELRMDLQDMKDMYRSQVRDTSPPPRHRFVMPYVRGTRQGQ